MRTDTEKYKHTCICSLTNAYIHMHIGEEKDKEKIECKKTNKRNKKKKTELMKMETGKRNKKMQSNKEKMQRKKERKKCKERKE